MTVRDLEVRINDRRVGLLREENDLWQFEYDATWCHSPQAFDLSPSLDRARGLHVDGATHRPVQWYFDNLLPEEALRTALAQEAEIDAADAFGLLACYGAESAGSLVLCDPARNAVAEPGLRPLAPEMLDRRIQQLPRVSLTRDAPKRMSLAGAQHKMLVVLRDGELFEPLPGTPSTHILKPDHPDEDYPASVMNEFFTMSLARTVGLDVPAVRLLRVPRPVYVVERFDRVASSREAGSPDSVQRRHVIDACQLLNKARTFKYVEAHLDTLAATLAHCRARAAARLKLYRWLLFNVLVGNGDNHLKNISFLVGPQGIEVAPAYDLLCTAAYETRAMAGEQALWPRTRLALTLGEARAFGDVKPGHLVAAAARLGLAEATARRELDRMRAALLPQADRLIARIEAGMEAAAVGSPGPEVAKSHLASELRLLRTIRHVVIADMVQQME